MQVGVGIRYNGSMTKGLVSMEEEESPGREIFIMRHGNTALNSKNEIRGWSNPPLDELGIEEAHNLGEAMLNDEIEADGIVSSDLMRSVQTCVIVSKITGIPLVGISKDFRPLDVGELTGTDADKAHKVIAEFAKNHPDDKIGTTGESFNVFKTRFLGGVVSLLNSNRGKRLIICSHSRGERILHAFIAEGCPDTFDVSLETFLAPGEDPATITQLFINSNLVLP